MARPVAVTEDEAMKAARANRSAEASTASRPSGLYATSRVVSDLGECYFYHTFDLPEYGLVPGDWDLRSNVGRYFGGADFSGKRVLEVGCASGFLTFEMENRGADVVAFDLCEDYDFHPVPYARTDHVGFQRSFKETNSRKLNNSWWLARRALGSKARVVYGTAYDIPPSIGSVDVATFGCILLHLRDPFLALQSALRLTRGTVVITEQRQMSWQRRLRLWLGGPSAAAFMPDFRKTEPRVVWWYLTPTVIRRMIGVLGFEDSTVTYHSQIFQGRKTPMFTVVGRRTCESNSPKLPLTVG
jgi:SAM-dependent methyltransferase